MLHFRDTIGQIEYFMNSILNEIYIIGEVQSRYYRHKFQTERIKHFPTFILACKNDENITDKKFRA